MADGVGRLAWTWPAAGNVPTVVGIDEAGRGCLAGPVYAAAVIWRTRPEATPENDALVRLVRDSKTLSRGQRDRVRAFIERHADAWGVGVASREEIDRVNILRATLKAMHRAVDAALAKEATSTSTEAIDDYTHVTLLVDGDRFEPYTSPRDGSFVSHTCITEGDAKVVAIAAASILAKTHRDEYMRGEHAHGTYPLYGWDRNAGYGTAEHMRALKEHGACPLHRTSFAPVRAAKQHDREMAGFDAAPPKS
ncbi:hypothetical protein FOA52_001591 [Chlamydomonas sp. UWO 241]|nr:hypothetical protein FOA52_001591 [Chlamydomonas sp. UWO 241]